MVGVVLARGCLQTTPNGGVQIEFPNHITIREGSSYRSQDRLRFGITGCVFVCVREVGDGGPWKSSRKCRYLHYPDRIKARVTKMATSLRVNTEE